MAERTAILNVVGLTPRLLGPDMPRLQRAAQAGGLNGSLWHTVTTLEIQDYYLD